MRVTGVKLTVFCSAIVTDVIVHCHTAGALLSQTAENNCPYHRVVGFLILSGQFKITNSFATCTGRLAGAGLGPWNAGQERRTGRMTMKRRDRA